MSLENKTDITPVKFSWSFPCDPNEEHIQCSSLPLDAFESLFKTDNGKLDDAVPLAEIFAVLTEYWQSNKSKKYRYEAWNKNRGLLVYAHTEQK
eukprot:CFRG6435T1